MKIQEIETLSERWHTLLNEPIHPDVCTAPAIAGILQERLTILHRLNELGESSIDGIPIIEALEQTNQLLRQINKTRQLVHN